MDYLRHARQIALPEIGPDGQAKLASTPVDLSAFDPVATELHARAGGVAGEGAQVVIEAPPHAARADALGVAAWACVEAARRALGEAPRAMPAGLVERLSAPVES